MAKEKETRCRNWTIIVYPESAPENWRDIIDEEHIEWVESPLHDQDKNADGQDKKPHYHVLLMFGGVKAYDQVLEFIQPLNCPIPKRTHNSRAMVRYFAHLDNPDKAQYDKSLIVPHGGVDLEELLKPPTSERYTMIKEMCEYVAKCNVMEFYELLDYAMESEFDTWFPLLCDSSAYIVNQYIKSNRQRVYNMRCHQALEEDGL